MVALATSTRWLCLSLLCLAQYSFQASLLGERKLESLSTDTLATLLTKPDPVKNVDPTNPSSHLSKILIPRAPGTENNTFVREYLISTLKKLNYHIETDEFTANTPIGKKKMVNVIATKDPKASRKLVLAAHFDSKWFPEAPMNQFVGATDSAAPCAMMLDVAEALNPMFEDRLKRIENGDLDEDDDIADLTLQLVFFDGEEAFHDWTDTDSIYGARNLAEKWAKTYVESHMKRRLMSEGTTEISTIEHFVLLDLLGAKQPLIRSYFLDTAWLFDALMSVEQRLGDMGAFAYGTEQSMAPGKWSSYFLKRRKNMMNMGYIGDDHVPFLRRGVSILHIIAEPFPHVWHKLEDDASALDIPTMRRWNLMLRVFLAEYFTPQLSGGKVGSIEEFEREQHNVARSVSDL